MKIGCKGHPDIDLTPFLKDVYRDIEALYELQKDLVEYDGSVLEDDLDLEERFPDLTKYKNILEIMFREQCK